MQTTPGLFTDAGEVTNDQTAEFLVSYLEAFGALEERVLGGDAPTLEQRALVRTATTWATEVAAEVADFAYRFAGTDSLRLPSDLQRAWRDIHAGTQHIFVDEKTYLDSAQVILGIAPENVPL